MQLLMRAVMILLSLAGCSTKVPLDWPKDESRAVPPGDGTKLGRSAAAWSERRDGQSGFYLLMEGSDALGARLRLINQAERTIDVQYFLVKNDRVGSLFAEALLRAADRGVRVRLLIDDIATSTDLDPQMSLLNSHPNIQLRLFNPVARGGFPPSPIG